jgi:hypothetical protein
MAEVDLPANNGRGAVAGNGAHIERPVVAEGSSPAGDSPPPAQHEPGPRLPADPSIVAGWLRRFFVAPGGAAELRVIYKDGSSHVGRFDCEHLEAMAERGLDLSRSDGAKGAYIVMNPLRREAPLRLRSMNQVQKARTGDCASKSDIDRRRWLLVDADPRRPDDQEGASANDQEKEGARTRVMAVRDYLSGVGWPLPLVADSGNGFHLLYEIDLPADDGGLVRRVLRALAARFSDAAVEIDRTVHDAARITKLYGSKACKGDDTPARPHRWTAITEIPDQLDVVPRELLERLAGEGPGAAGPAGCPVLPPASSGLGEPRAPSAAVIARARAYVAKMAPAVEGQGGDRQTYTVAATLVKDFALTPEQALPLLLEYNTRCRPPWQESDLRRKLDMADQAPGERGAKLRRPSGAGTVGTGGADLAPASPASAAADGDPYLATVPDFVLADWGKVRPGPRPRDAQGRLRRGRRVRLVGIWGLLHSEIIHQRRSVVHLPDVLLAQVVWGGRRSWPPNWRRTVRAWLYKVVAWDVLRDPAVPEEQAFAVDPACPAHCPLHGRADVRHQHFVVTVPRRCGPSFPGALAIDYGASFLGALELFRYERNGDSLFDFSAVRDDDPDYREEIEKEVANLKKRGWICAIYLPALVFGSSRRTGLTPEDRKLLLALPRELTRSKTSDREDKAHVLVGGRPDITGHCRLAVCPFLEAGVRYVAFNGNAGYRRRHLRGRGYHLLGRTGRGWLRRAGVAVPDEARARWKAVRAFLTVLRKMSGPFGLVAAGWHPGRREWRSLDDLLTLTKTPAGRRWLTGCFLRVYARDDYLARWRQYLASRMGLSHIPGGGDEGEPTPPSAGAAEAVRSAEDLACWMRRRGLTDQQLAAWLGVSRRWVTEQRSGRRRWSRTFEARLAAVLAAARPPDSRG